MKFGSFSVLNKYAKKGLFCVWSDFGQVLANSCGQFLIRKNLENILIWQEKIAKKIVKLQWLCTAWLLTTLIWRKISCFFVGKNREMVDKESMAGDGLWQNCNNTDGWVQDYREDEGSTLYLLRRSNEIRFLSMLHDDRFDGKGMARNGENPGRRR